MQQVEAPKTRVKARLPQFHRITAIIFRGRGQYPYMRARVNRASELICRLRAAWCVGGAHTRDSRRGACAPKKEQEDRDQSGSQVQDASILD